MEFINLIQNIKQLLVDFNIIVTILILLFVFLLCLYFVRKFELSKHLVEKFHLKNEKITKGYCWLIFGFVIIIIEGFILNYLHCYNIYIDAFGRSLLFNILTLLGIIFAAFGFFIAYRQFKMQEDRIDGYDKLYREINALLEDGKMTKFQFFGSTLIPGQIAYGESNVLEEYRKKIVALSQTEKIKKNLNFIILDDNLTKSAYEKYKGQTIHDLEYDDEKIAEKIKELNEDFKGPLSKFITEIKDERRKTLVDNYYFSNGQTVIYVTPLHYLEANYLETKIEKQGDKTNEPNVELIGFKTTDRSIVKAFENKFKKMKSNIEENNKNAEHTT